MLIAQAMYEFSANRSRHSCPHYFVGDEVWLNAKNLNTARLTVKLNDCHVRPFKVKRIFEKNLLVIELKLSEFMKVHSVFHVTLLSHVATDSLSGQCQELWEPVITENDERAWYVTRIFNSKVNQCFNSLLLKYYVKWEGYFPTWKPFYLMNNCQQALCDSPVKDSPCGWLSRLTRALALVDTGRYLVLLALTLFFLL